MARGQGPTAVILLGVLMAAAALVGFAALRALRPLVSPEDDRTVMIGQRTRVALEREKMLTLRSIKELEFDRAMGKLSDEDWQEMSGRLRARAARLMRQLDAGAGYREQIERDLRSGSETPTLDRRDCRATADDRARSARPSASARRARRRTTPTRGSARAAGSEARRRESASMRHEGHGGRRAGSDGRASFLCVLGVLCVLCDAAVRAAGRLRDARSRSRCRASRGRSTICRTARSRSA